MGTPAVDFPWERNGELQLARANLMACAYNAAVSYGSERGHRKMRQLIDAINEYERIEGAAKLQFLVDREVIDSYEPCPSGCQMRPGGLFHESGCENEFNTELSRQRRERADDELPRKWTHAASPSLVGRLRGDR